MIRRKILWILFECQTEKTTCAAQQTKASAVGRAGAKHREKEADRREKNADTNREGEIEQIRDVLLCLSFTGMQALFMQINVVVSIYDVATMLLSCSPKLSSLLDHHGATIIEDVHPV